MKRFLALLLLIATLLTTTSCSSGLQMAETQTNPDPGADAKTETETEEPLPTGEIVYPEGFSVGYNRQSVAPEVFPVQTYTHFNHMGYSNHDPVQLTCTAISDGKTAFLLISLDIRGVESGFVDYSTRLIEQAVGIPKEQVFINATHTHSAPDNSHLGEGNLKQWVQLYYKRLVRAVTLAMHDLTPAEAYIGTSHTDGVTFVRRYLLENGYYKCNPSKEDKPVAHESEADNELRTVRFDREGKKDVLLVNYQTHYHGTFATQVSADFVHPLRQKIEKELDVHFAYHNGASGNLNFQSALGEKKYPTLEKAAYAIGDTVIDAVKNETKAELGSLQHEVSYFKSRKGIEVRLSSFTIGDIGFAAAPYEMFDTNGVQIREGSSCKMTFVCAYTNGHMGYCPSALAFPHGAYEVEGTRFANGDGEAFADELIRLLNLCKSKGE